jgi:hypothetical protein
MTFNLIKIKVKVMSLGQLGQLVQKQNSVYIWISLYNYEPKDY